MNAHTQLLALTGIFCFQMFWGADLPAGSQVTTDSSRRGRFFQFGTIPAPAVNDVAASGIWRIAAGRLDANSGPKACLSDGRIPSGADEPAGNMFFTAGSAGGLIMLDLQKLVQVTEIVSYSWHPGSRAAQLYSVFGATGEEPDFAFPESASEVDQTTGWRRIAEVDTRSTQPPGGQHAACIKFDSTDPRSFRYLLFMVQATDSRDPFSHTFFSEIDVVGDNPEVLERIPVPQVREQTFTTTDKAYRFRIDTTQAQELEEWSTLELQPVIREWYPRIVAMLPSEGFEAPREVYFRYLPDAEMRGIPAFASGATVSLNAEWFRGQLQREARGAVVHEMVHVVQQYPGGNRRDPSIRTPPGWLVEGIADYIRWFHFEPQTQGAVLSPERLRSARHDASYRVSGNFLDWVIRSGPVDDRILQRLNAIVRSGQYSTDTWSVLTGVSEEQLAEAWRGGLRLPKR